MQGKIGKYDGSETDRLVQKVYNLEVDDQVREFMAGQAREITVPGSARKMSYDPLKRIGIGVSLLGTSKAVSIGAYAFALNELDKGTG
jgi:glucokinase